ncbi:MAG: hypothetical protein A6F70_02290 [Cycloclasticus sp. symbiont of Bathymodiolus heckerae]|nr:MAG: hypothetical protein A6F70_02290 [Cycloclasticus sp. symbiont of Bathymodiolus heckerae]
MAFLESNSETNKGDIFFPADRQQRLDLILHLIPNTQQVILLRGPEQSGKSFFIRQFQAQADEAWRVCLLPAKNLLDGDAPLQICADAFDALEGNEKQILVRFTSWSKAGKKVIICVEDAHQLDESRFNFLFQLSESYDCLHILLTSSENLGEAVESRCQLIDIEPFTQKQTSEYARQRINKNGLDFINVAGLDDVVLFIETGGLPGRINDALSQMIHLPSKQSEKPEETKPFPLLWAVGMAFVVVVLVLSLFSGSEEKVTGNVVEKIRLESPAEVVVKASEHKPPVVKQSVRVEKKSDFALVNVVQPQVEEPLVKAIVLPKKEAPILQKEVSKNIIAAIQEKTEQAVESEAGEGPKELSKIKVSVVNPKKTLSLIQKDHAWINEVNGQHYTLQLLGVSQEESAVEYVQAHRAISALHLFQNKRNKGHWYTVIYGNFNSKNDAMRAAKELPITLGKLQPWARSFDAVRNDMYLVE